MSEPDASRSVVRPVERAPMRFGCLFVSLLSALLVWATATITGRLTTPSEVRLFHRHTALLQAHAESVRSGQLKPDTDPNGIVRYRLPDELRRKGMVCIVSDGIIWYHLLPSHPIDAVSPCLVIPLDRKESVTQLPQRVGKWTHTFMTLEGDWAYWLVHSG
jgi:hypothetical protein